jgi:hypothetical protein
MELLKELTVKAGQLCGATRLDVDIFEVDGALKMKHKHVRKSNKYVRRASYEKCFIIIRDNQGKEVERIDTKPKAKKEEPKTKETPKKEQAGNKDI